MKHLFLVTLAILSSCAAPISYINNLPKSSGLQEKGDVIVGVNLGSDVTRRDKMIQARAAWSPIQNFGFDLEYTGHLKLEGKNERLDKIQLIEGSLIYYQPVNGKSGVEFKISMGSGEVGGFSTIFNFPGLPAEKFIVFSEYRTLGFQSNYNFALPDENSKLTLGFRVRNVQFDNYLYSRFRDETLTGQSFSQANWNVYILDPFLEVNQEISGSLYLNYRVSYSILDGTVRDSFRHPFYRRLGISLGMQMRF